MASVLKRGKSWYAKFRDASGRWRMRATTAQTKAEAKRLASDLERQAERRRLGLEPLPADEATTLGDLLRWWEKTYFELSPAYAKSRGTFRRHLLESDFAKTAVREVTTGRVEQFIQAKTRELSPQTVNHVRGFLCRVFSAARRAGKVSQNPVLDVERRRVPKRLPSYLAAEEVPLVLLALRERWRPLFATAIYSGLRKGELAGLRKSDVDFTGRLINVCRSYGRDTTKGGRAEAVPIASELLPYLEAAIKRSPSELVFPNEDGSMMKEEASLQERLQSALARAGIVTGYVHVCRRKGCGHSERAADAELRRCPKCAMKLWPRPHVRKIRFHDLRHTTATLLMMAGANPAAVQRILRHSDPRITTEVYGHLAPEYLRKEIDLLSFTRPLPDDRERGSCARRDPFGALVVQGPNAAPLGSSRESREPLEMQGLLLERETGLGPATLGLGSRCSTN
jgi:integrase